jgi:hypothetical protein
MFHELADGNPEGLIGCFGQSGRPEGPSNGQKEQKGEKFPSKLVHFDPPRIGKGAALLERSGVACQGFCRAKGSASIAVQQNLNQKALDTLHAIV